MILNFRYTLKVLIYADTNSRAEPQKSTKFNTDIMRSQSVCVEINTDNFETIRSCTKPSINKALIYFIVFSIKNLKFR